ncbi:hypothetical protein [Janthinobacterium psychrotolerans]|uniref:DUF4136 domain-containing protein n=1 Tax=Janthinobacterium psychrotolerans TaxID=1747903 RepID=A0A1A7C5G4_9BURK|nr:hypothetical protein [Janthinobacterium psychrotolerans]OBV41161.1 hypothetical protein ASR47_102518 [Janthinobacterium psychrotolerans]
MKITRMLFIGLLTINNSGCANFDPTLNGLINIGSDSAPTPGSINRAIAPIYTSTTTPSKEDGCTVLPNRKSKVDVDTLYGRAMTRFGFKSPEQIAIYRKTIDRTYLVDQGYKHEKQGGAFYHLAQTVPYGVPGVPRAMWLEFKFSKNGSGSDVTAEFCVDPADPIASSSNNRHKITSRIQEIFGG